MLATAPLVLLLLSTTSLALRCYTDIAATKVTTDHSIFYANSILIAEQSASLECGMSTGCLKIYRKAAQRDELGRYIPTHKRGTDTPLYRGCFLVATPDTCFDNKKDGLSYCWCRYIPSNIVNCWTVTVTVIGEVECCSHTDLCNSAPRPAALPTLLGLASVFSVSNANKYTLF